MSGAAFGHILLVDDSTHNLRLLEMVLAPAGYSVEQAESGLEALKAFEARQPDLVLLDLLMPQMDGFETCKRLRALKGGSEVPIVFVTGLTDLGSHNRAMESGADDFISKPVNRTELLVRVRSLLWIKRLKDELREGYELIRSQRDALLTAQQQRESLTSLVVHDLKSPLSAIVFNAEWLVESCTGEDADSARQIRSAAFSMNRMVMNLLDISRSEDGALVPRIVPVDLEKLAREMEQSQARHDTRHQLQVENPPLNIEADADLLRRLLENLIDNAKKYSPVESPIRVVIAAPEPGWVEITVSDQGPGIPAALREKIFDKYARLDPSINENEVTSRGLGLTFCRLAAEVHGGKIWVEDNLPQGSAFHVRLPASREAVLDAPEAPAATPHEP